jgi:type II pantothenate kinase
LIPKAYHSPRGSGNQLGADIGATLAKLAIRAADGSTDYRLVPTQAIEQVAREVESLGPRRLALTGGGALRLARLLGSDTAPVSEFAAWGAGARELLGRAGIAAEDRFLLVSLGTGTSASLVDGDSVVRLGGTAIGGGTVVGLGAALLGTPRFDELCELSRRGDRRRVDLIVSDIYGDGEPPLPGDLTASSFAKLAGPAADEPPSGPDLAHAIMGLVGENVGLICFGLAAAARVKQVVFGGTTLRGNPALVEILREASGAMGRSAVFLAQGEFTGALGALALPEG